MRPRFTKKALTVSRESGFTLIETMLVITLFALFVIVAYQAIVAGAQAKANGSCRRDPASDAARRT